MTTFVLVHSPIVGPYTWKPVAAELRVRHGVAAVVPVLDTPQDAAPPYWRRHAEAVARAVDSLPASEPLVLVGHSGAGPLLPAVRDTMDRPVAAYLFVDAGIPEDGKSRLDLLREELPDVAGQVDAALKAGARLPAWTDADLQDALPDAALRRAVLDELQPQSLAFYEEPLPVFSGWPDAPCAYLQFSPGYNVPAARARREGWPSRNLEAGHFHLVLEPAAVAGALHSLTREAGVPLPA